MAHYEQRQNPLAEGEQDASPACHVLLRLPGKCVLLQALSQACRGNKRIRNGGHRRHGRAASQTAAAVDFTDQP